MGILCRSIRISVVTFFLLLSFASSIRIINNNNKNHSIPKPGGSRWTAEIEIANERRRLGGLGSWPPACKSKCGICSPCDAVHVAIQPGFSTPQEYYPEAWRCKCGNKLFMP